MRSLVVSWQLLAVTLALTGTSAARAGADAGGEAAAFVARYAALHAAGEVHSLLALHTEDSELLLPGQPPIRGQQALADLFTFDAALDSRLEIAAATFDGDDLVLGAIAERNALFAALGLESIRYLPGTRITLRDGSIARTRAADLEPASRAELEAALGTALTWLRRYRPAELAEHLPDGRFRYDARAAHWWRTALADRNAAPARPSPEAEAAERLGRELMAIWQSGETAALAGIVAPEAVYEENVRGQRFVGVDGFAGYVGHVHRWASEVEMRIDRVTVGNGHAHFEWRFRAVQSGPLGDLVPDPTRRRVEVRGATLVETRDGRIVRAADHLDGLGFVLSLGARIALPGGRVLERP